MEYFVLLCLILLGSLNWYAPLWIFTPSFMVHGSQQNPLCWNAWVDIHTPSLPNYSIHILFWQTYTLIHTDSYPHTKKYVYRNKTITCLLTLSANRVRCLPTHRLSYPAVLTPVGVAALRLKQVLRCTQSSPQQTAAHLGKRRDAREGWTCSHSVCFFLMKQNRYLFVYAMRNYVTAVCSYHWRIWKASQLSSPGCHSGLERANTITLIPPMLFTFSIIVCETNRVVWKHSGVIGALFFSGCGTDGHEYGNWACSTSS